MVRLLPHTPEGVQGTRWLGVDYRQANTPSNHLGRLVSSSRKNMRLLEDAARQTYIYTHQTVSK